MKSIISVLIIVTLSIILCVLIIGAMAELYKVYVSTDNVRYVLVNKSLFTVTLRDLNGIEKEISIFDFLVNYTLDNE